MREDEVVRQLVIVVDDVLQVHRRLIALVQRCGMQGIQVGWLIYDVRDAAQVQVCAGKQCSGAA